MSEPGRWTLYGEGYFLPESLLGGESVDAIEAAPVLQLLAEALAIADTAERVVTEVMAPAPAYVIDDLKRLHAAHDALTSGHTGERSEASIETHRDLEHPVT
jgi:hypothetical protein